MSTSLWNIIGHEKAVKTLQRSLDEDRLSHAYLLSGPPNIGKKTLAIELAKAANCLGEEKPCGICLQCVRIARGVHTDTRIVGLNIGNLNTTVNRVNIGIDSIRDIQRESNLKPYEARYRFFIFNRAETMSEEAANAILKTLEEPPDQVILVMLTTNHRLLLPTVLSRCQHLSLRPVPLPTIAQILVTKLGLDEARSQEIAHLSNGRPGWALHAANERSVIEELQNKITNIEKIVSGTLEERFSYAADIASWFRKDRESVHAEIELWIGWWRDILLMKAGAPKFMTNLSRHDKLRTIADSISSTQISESILTIHKTLELLEKNVNPMLALENMMLTLPRV